MYKLRDWIDLNKLDWSNLSMNKCEGAICLLEENIDKINWIMLSYNPSEGAIRLLEKNPNKIYWSWLSENPSEGAIRLLEKNKHKINWSYLSRNPSEGAIRLLEKNQDKINWSVLSSNPSEGAIRLLEKNQDKINWLSLSSNPSEGASYNNMKNFTATYNDILNVSLCHSLYFGNVYALEYVDCFIDNAINDDNNYESLINYINNKIDNKNVLLNPALGHPDLKIGADADLIIDKELIDIKVSQCNIGDNIKDFTQLIIYICLYYYKTGIKCDKITIFNPILSYEKYIDLTYWDNFDKIIQLLKNRIN